tara:strand:+ start:1391 stop:1915 length:525 start_codon:yes stop_codon:yes gene_type:complete
MMPRWVMPLRFGLTGIAVLGLGMSVPGAFDAQRADQASARDVAQLKMDAPAAKRALAQHKKQLSEVSEKFALAKMENASLADKVKAVESSSARCEAELGMRNGALVVAEQVLSANCETLKLDLESTRAELEAARVKIGTLVTEIGTLASANASALDTKSIKDGEEETKPAAEEP